MKKEVIAEMIREQMRKISNARGGLNDAEFEYRNSTLVGHGAVVHGTFEAIDTALSGVSQLLVSVVSLIEASKEYEDGVILNEWNFENDN